MSQARAEFTAADVPDLSGRTFLVTGANTGIGFEAAKVFAGRGARVLLGCRSQGRATAACTAIRSEIPGSSVNWLPLDLADLDSVRKAAEIAAGEERLDVLVNNAGVMHPPLGFTKDGFELQFGINHLGHFALTGLLLDKLSAGKEPRVVTVASIAHKRGDIDFDNLDGHAGYSRNRFYSQSKLANMLFFAELDRRLRKAGSPIRSIGCHPGVAATELGRNHAIEKVVFPLLGTILNTAQQGAWPTMQAATDPGAEGGDYFGAQDLFEMRGPSGPASRTARAQDTQLAARLWDVSVDMTGIDPKI